MFNINVLPAEEDGDKVTKWGVYVDDKLIGTSKNRYDADFAAQVLVNKIQQIIELEGPQ